MGLFKSLSVVSFFTLVSRLLGLVREMVLAAKFGASASTDALFVAFRIPNLLRRLFAEGAFAQAFVPILAEYRRSEGDERAKLLIAHVASLLSLLLLIISILGVLFAPYLVYCHRNRI
jgi:putative peptidoglycan lipid II flippase